MRWPWQWRRRKHCNGHDVERAKQQLVEARNRLAATQLQGHEVTEVAEALRELRSRNHFGPMITEALRGKR